jgi:hypothetical protein
LKRKLTVNETNELLSLGEKDINMTLLKDYFAVRQSQKEARFNTYDTFFLPSGKLFNQERLETTIGRYLFNFYVIPKKYLQKYGYQDIVFDADSTGDLENKLSYMLLEDEIDSKEYARYLDRGEWLTMGTAYFLSPTMDYDINVPIPEVIKLRDELFEKYKEDIKKGDPNVADLIENQLLSLAKKILKEKGSEAYDFFESGEFNFKNNYKKTSVFAGALENPYTKKLEILKSNYVEGISKDEFHHFANLTIIGGYSRNVETQKGGYETKKINNAVQGIMLDEAGSDCGTTQYLNVSIPVKMKSMFLHRYILDAGKLTLLDENNIGRFIGKDIKMRSPMFCKSEDKICSKCAGELFYKLNMKNAGLLSTTMSGNLMNMSMKKFHNTSVVFSKIDVDKFIKEH